jgi:hypothetical protein
MFGFHPPVSRQRRRHRGSGWTLLAAADVIDYWIDLDNRDALKALYEQEEYQERLLSNYVADVGISTKPMKREQPVRRIAAMDTRSGPGRASLGPDTHTCGT